MRATHLGLRQTSGRLWALMTVLLLVTAGAGYLVAGMVDQVRIGSERYDRIIAMKDLQAAVSAPSLQVTQTQLAVQKLALSADEVRPNDLAALSRRERGYEQRYEAWVTQLAEFADPDLQAALDASHAAAGAYFEAVDGAFLSAARAGDREGMQEVASGTLAQQYDLQQASAEKVARLAQVQLDSVERSAAADLVTDRRLMMVAGLLFGFLAVALTLVTLRSMSTRLRRMRHLADKEFPHLVARAEATAEVGGNTGPRAMPAVRGNDEMARTERSLHRVVDTAVDLAAQTARLRHTTADLFSYTGRRNHRLLSQSLNQLSGLEAQRLDPERRADLGDLRNALTRMRRNAEGMLVLAGATSSRHWVEPVLPSHSLTAALAEIEGADQVVWDLDDSVAIVGPAGADLAQLLAELLDNAMRSSPESPVSVSGLREGDDYAVVISDEGLGMPAVEVAAANELLAKSEVDFHDSRRMGLSIVARLADRHDFQVTLAARPSGGLVARVRIPAACLKQLGATPAGAPATLSMVGSGPGSGPGSGLGIASTEVAATPGPLVGEDQMALPRRIRGASLDPVLREVPAYVGVPERRSPEAVRDALTALAAGRAAAAGRHPDQPGLIP